MTPGAVTEYQIQIFPTLATIAAGDRLRLTLSTADTPHLTPLPPQLPQLAGGIYTIERSATARPRSRLSCSTRHGADQPVVSVGHAGALHALL